MSAWAQDFRTWDSFHEGNKNKHSLISRALDKLFAPRPAKPAWVQAIEKQVRNITPNGGLLVGPIVTDYVPSQPEPAVATHQQQAVHTAKQAWQQALSKHPAPVYGFQVKVLRPQDVAALSPAEVKNVTDVLSGTVAAPEMEVYKHYIVRVTLPGEQPIHLLFNCYMRELYVVRGNANLPQVRLERMHK